MCVNKILALLFIIVRMISRLRLEELLFATRSCVHCFEPSVTPYFHTYGDPNQYIAMLCMNILSECCIIAWL